ncbi:MAG: ABC transporter permease [Clostridia bacterium]|nr:ABC transporter permease [Clostridia bacterium]
MRFLAFATRNRKEILRDPLNLVFGIGFPVILILLIALLKKSIQGMPAELFPIQSFAPGMAVFGLSFISLFLGVLIASDRSSSFLMRVFASPLSGADYIIGYSLPLLPVALFQSAVCFITAFFFGLPVNINIVLAIIVLIPVGALFISFGLIMGSLLSYKQVGGISSVIINLAQWLSGTWFDLKMIGGIFKTVCYTLPFAHAVDSVKAAIAGDYGSILPHLLWVIGYTIVLYFIAVIIFRKKMKE